MRPTIILFVILLTGFNSFSQKPELVTLFEKTNGLESPNYDSTISFCKELEKASGMVKLAYIGKTAQGRDIPFVIVNKGKIFDIQSVKNSSKTILLIQACIHSGEPDGKDAGLLLIRDIITKPELLSLLDKVTILFLPMLNPDGHENNSIYNRVFQNGPRERGCRTSAQNLNLNRDFSKADSPEIKSWLKMYHQWNPDFFIDCHVTDGADYQYIITYNFGIFGNMTPSVTHWAKDIYLSYIENEMKKFSKPISYYVEFNKISDPKSGIISGIWGPMYSDEYVSVNNRPAFLIETHMYKDYHTRVINTYELLKQSIILLNKESTNLKKILKENDEFVSSKEFRKQPFNLTFELSHDSIMIDFLGYEYQIVKSDISGGDWSIFDNKKPVTQRIPFFNKPIPKVQCIIPEAYIIPVEWLDVIERIRLHGIKVKRLKEDLSIKTQMGKLSNIVYENQPFEGHTRMQSFDIHEFEDIRIFHKGSAVIETSQPTAQLIAHLLEANGPVSFLSWGFFNTCFQVKEKPEDYIIEVIARNMIKNDPQLLSELNELKKQDPEFSKNSSAILNWFFNKSEFADKSLNVYPVGKIYNSQELFNILKSCIE